MRTLAGGFFALVLLAVPASAYAANATFFGPVVPEECHCKETVGEDKIVANSAPDYGCALQVLQNVFNLVISLGCILFVLYLVLSGFMLVMSGGSSEARSQAKTRLLNVVIGMAVMLLAWLIVDYVMKTLYNQNVQFGPWNAILAGNPDGSDRCIVPKKPTTLIEGSLAIVANTTPGTGSNAQTGAQANTASGNENAVRKQFSDAGVPVNKAACPYNTPFQSVSGGCTTVGGLQQNTIKQVITLKSVCGSVQVTGGNELGHSAGHTSGTKVDLDTNIDSCIQGGHGGYFARNGSREGDPQYRDKCGNIYVRESDHWDITVGSVCAP